MSRKFIHSADLHLDSPLLGLPLATEQAQALRGATRKAFERVISTAMEEHVDFLILAGDIYDAGLKSYDNALYFHGQMARLQEARIKVFLIYGNHDALSKLDRKIRLPTNVHVFPGHQATTYRDDEELGIAIHGQSFNDGSVTQNVALAYPTAVPDLLNVGVLHTSLAGASGHDNYAPCSLDDLVAKGYDYWALGHVHQPEVVCRDPWVIYPGITQARQRREAGPKSCRLVTFSDTGIEAVEERATDAIPWLELDVDVSGARTFDEAMDALAARLAGLPPDRGAGATIVGLTLSGATEAFWSLSEDPDRLRAEAEARAGEVSQRQIWLTSIRLRARPHLDLDALAKQDDPLGEVLRTVRGLSTPDSHVLAEVLAPLKAHLPEEIYASVFGTSLSDNLLSIEGIIASRLAKAATE